jgi:hypothetical protein
VPHAHKFKTSINYKLKDKKYRVIYTDQ